MVVEFDPGDTYLIQDVALWAYAASDRASRGIDSADATVTTVASWSAPNHANISSVDSYDVYFGTCSDVTSNPI